MLKNLFKNRYPDLSGKDWIKKLSPEDRQVFIQIGLAAMEYGKAGGQARVQKARRDERGRFTKE